MIVGTNTGICYKFCLNLYSSFFFLFWRWIDCWLSDQEANPQNRRNSKTVEYNRTVRTCCQLHSDDQGEIQHPLSNILSMCCIGVGIPLSCRLLGELHWWGELLPSKVICAHSLPYSLDIAPKYSGVLMGITNTFATMAGTASSCKMVFTKVLTLLFQVSSSICLQGTLCKIRKAIGIWYFSLLGQCISLVLSSLLFLQKEKSSLVQSMRRKRKVTHSNKQLNILWGVNEKWCFFLWVQRK